MADRKLANSVVQSLSHYLVHKRTTPSLYDAKWEILLGRIDGRLIEPSQAQTVESFRANPTDSHTTEALQHQVEQEMARTRSSARTSSRRLEVGWQARVLAGPGRWSPSRHSWWSPS